MSDGEKERENYTGVHVAVCDYACVCVCVCTRVSMYLQNIHST